MLVGAPSMRNAASARSALRHRVGEVRRRAVHDQLGEQRVEAGIGAVAGVAEGVDAHARARRRLEHAQRAAAGPGRAVRGHGLHVDAQLHRMAARRRHAACAGPGRRATPPASRSCGCTRSTPVHLLGDGVLDLQARIGLDEDEVARCVDQELEGAEAAVFHGLGHARRPRPTIFLRTRRREVRGWARSRRSSGCAAAGCIRARPEAAMPPLPSPTICTSMWRARPTSRST